MVVRLTKAQQKDRDMILAWASGEPFKANSRAKPAIPELTREEVLEKYVPMFVTDGGKFYTPLEMGSRLWASTPLKLVQGYKILEPCAGIGHLLYYPYRHTRAFIEGEEGHAWEEGDIEPLIDAYELDEEALKIGNRLFPGVYWTFDSPLSVWEDLVGAYDLVLMNPPFNITWATGDGIEMSEGKATKSEHLFLELAIRALKPGGVAGVIAPYNYIDRLPKKLKTWFEDEVDGWIDLGEMPGEFRLSSIRVHGWIITKKPEAPEEPEVAVQRGQEPDEHALEVPEYVIGGLALLLAAGHDAWASPTATIRALKKLREKEAAAWLEAHSLRYGEGYYHGFKCRDDFIRIATD